MWRPDTVVQQHRTRAKIVWISLLLTILSYTIWEIYNIVHERENPSTSLTLSNEAYTFPFVDACLEGGYGCSATNASDCGGVNLYRVPWAEYGDDTVIGTLSEDFPTCVGFDLSAFNVIDGDISPATTVNIQVVWAVNDSAQPAYNSFLESIQLYLGGKAAGGVSVAVPYSRLRDDEEGELLYDLTSVTIGKTTRKFLEEDSITTFPVLTLSTTQLVSLSDDPGFNESTLGFLSVNIAQGSYSQTTVEDNDPLDIGAFFGNVGGFWELLIVIWALFFVAHRREEVPALTARNFTETIQHGKAIITRRDTTSSATPPSSGPDPVEEKAHWEMESGRIFGAGNNTPIPPQQNTSPPRHSFLSASFRRPVVFDTPRRAGDSTHSIGSSTPSIKATTTSGAPPPSYDDFQPA